MELDNMVDALCRQPRMREMMENLQEAVVIVDNSGKIWDYNSQFRQLAGMSQSEDLTFRNLFKNFPFESSEQKHNLLLESIGTLEPRKSSWVRYESPTGEKYVNISITPFHDKTGAQIGLYDVTAEVLEATIDALTGAYSSSHYLRHLQGRSIIEAERSERKSLGTIGIDVKGLKRVNDYISPAEGDTILRETARILAESVRKTDYVVRKGGDEFTLLCPGAGENDIERIKRRIETKREEYNGSIQNPDLRIELYITSKASIGDHDESFRWVADQIGMQKRKT